MDNLIAAAAVVIPVALLSAIVAYVRTGELTRPESLRARGFRASARRSAIRFLVTALILGYLAAGTYGWLVDFQPDNALTFMVWAGFAVAAVLSVTAAFVRPRLGLGGLPEIVLLSVLWGATYGWLLPEAIRSYGAG